MVSMTGGYGLSDYRSRSVVIEVAGMANQTISRASNYQVKVPFSQMSVALRNISCQGGKVVKVTVQGQPVLETVEPASSSKPTVQAIESSVDSQPAKTNTSTKSVKRTKAVASKKKSPRKKATNAKVSNRKRTRAKKTS
ncbi:MAG: hypothetical protein F6K11_01320 [Leptolyngbya sp. SIO3F4]|nr:hypothetical protein [Leptolyngbya sp. SIO3F4]